LALFRDRLLNMPGPAGIADVELAGENADIIGAKEAYDLNIAAGKEDLASYFGILLDALEAIPEEGERIRALGALYRVLNATYLIAKSGNDPIRTLISQNKQASVARTAREKKLAPDRHKRDERDKIVLAVVDEHKRCGEQVSWEKLQDLVNKKLHDNNLDEIERSTFYRIKRKKSGAALQG
jgi:hypothetical protein